MSQQQEPDLLLSRETIPLKSQITFDLNHIRSPLYTLDYAFKRNRKFPLLLRAIHKPCVPSSRFLNRILVIFFRADLYYYQCEYSEALKLYTELYMGGLLKSAAQKRDVGEAVARTLSMLGMGASLFKLDYFLII